MRKIMIVILLLFSMVFTNCATLFGGKVLASQKRKPLAGEPQREMKVGFFLLDILFWPSLIVDFSTGAIYKPSKTNTMNVKKKKKKSNEKMF